MASYHLSLPLISAVRGQRLCHVVHSVAPRPGTRPGEELALSKHLLNEQKGRFHRRVDKRSSLVQGRAFWAKGLAQVKRNDEKNG